MGARGGHGCFPKAGTLRAVRLPTLLWRPPARPPPPPCSKLIPESGVLEILKKLAFPVAKAIAG